MHSEVFKAAHKQAKQGTEGTYSERLSKALRKFWKLAKIKQELLSQKFITRITFTKKSGQTVSRPIIPVAKSRITGKGMSWNPFEKGMMSVFRMNGKKSHWIMINLETVSITKKTA